MSSFNRRLVLIHTDTKSDAEKKQLYSKVEKYLARAEEIKELVKTGDKGIKESQQSFVI